MEGEDKQEINAQRTDGEENDRDHKERKKSDRDRRIEREITFPWSFLFIPSLFNFSSFFPTTPSFPVHIGLFSLLLIVSVCIGILLWERFLSSMLREKEMGGVKEKGENNSAPKKHMKSGEPQVEDREREKEKENVLSLESVRSAHSPSLVGSPASPSLSGDGELGIDVVLKLQRRIEQLERSEAKRARAQERAEKELSSLKMKMKEEWGGSRGNGSRA